MSFSCQWGTVIGVFGIGGFGAYSHVIPSQPMAKNVLKPNKNTVATTPYSVLNWGAPSSFVVPVDVLAARMIIEAIMPKAPKSMSGRRPVRSMRGSAISEARKYSLPLAAPNRRESAGPKPREFSKTKVA